MCYSKCSSILDNMPIGIPIGCYTLISVSILVYGVD